MLVDFETYGDIAGPARVDDRAPLGAQVSAIDGTIRSRSEIRLTSPADVDAFGLKAVGECDSIR